MSGVGYAALSCKTSYSFLEGASQPDELIEDAHRKGIVAIAVTDRDGVYGIVQAWRKARELGVQLITGAALTVVEREGDDVARAVAEVRVLVRTREGYANLCRLITRGRLRNVKGRCAVTWGELCGHAGGLTLLLDAVQGDAVTRQLQGAFGGWLRAVITRHLEAGDEERIARVQAWAARHRLRVAAATHVLYHAQVRKRLHDVMTCIRHGVTLATAGTRVTSNAEHDLKTPHAFRQLFEGYASAVEETLAIAEECRFTLDELRYRYPSERLPDGTTTRDWLRALTFEGAAKRYPDGVPDDVVAQLDKELTLIGKLDYEGYFLTMYEIVTWCRGQSILCQGRGSAANSAVCYCLGITAIDPVRMGLLFERFLSLERAEPPDIDLDIQNDRREEVIQWVYEKYGRTHAAMVANVIRYRAKSAMREVGKVLGFDEGVLGRFSKLLSHWGRVRETVVSEAGYDAGDSRFALLVEMAQQLEGFPRHLGIHPGGFLLGHEPVATLVPIENATMEGRTVIQWDKDDIEALGLFKVDLLGLGALAMCDIAFKLLRAHRGVEMTMATTPAEDVATYEMIQRGDTVGTFQIESRAQMSMLPRLKPRTFYDLVIEVAIVRPGPISGGMVHPYLRRRNGEEAVEYPHACLRPVLEKTLGVPLFQEQVMKLAVVAADYTPGEADQLRRDMAAWRKTGRIEGHQQRLTERMVAKGIAPEFAERVFNQIKGFGEYGFPESHAASFALISYVTCYLKCHYPAEFMTALLNAQPMGFYAPGTIIEDGLRHGVEVRPIDVGVSEWDCTLEPARAGPHRLAVRMGLRYVKSLRLDDWVSISVAREAGPFVSLEDFVRRTRCNRGAVEALAEAGAFESLGVGRREALWQAALATAARNELALDGAERSPVLAGLTEFEVVTWDYTRTSHSTRGHPMGPLRRALRERGLRPAVEVNGLRDGSRVRYAGMVTCRQRPGTASGVVFVTLEDESGMVNVIVWPKVFEKYSVVARTEGLLGVTGRLQHQEGVVHLIAESLWPLLRDEPRPELPSRNFH